MSLLKRAREQAGVALLDFPRFQRALRQPSGVIDGAARGWISLHNRIEHVTPNPRGSGVQCDWQWGSELHACHAWPALGRQLMQAALREWPVRFADAPVSRAGPRISFVFAHSGHDRTKQLHRTIRSVFAQEAVEVECVVVDQSPSSIEGKLPNGIRYRHLSKAGVSPGWHKSWAFNVAARIATGDIVVFQDGDVCVPQRYGAELARSIVQDGNDVASLQRFLFYLSPGDTQRLESEDALHTSCVPERVFQNWKGGTIAVRRDTFFKLGGFDEGFVDWGGEDDEFFDRCHAVGHCRFGYLPFVHLWHAPQPDRKLADNPNIAQVMPKRMQIPVADRIADLATRGFGSTSGPDPSESYKSAIGMR